MSNEVNLQDLSDEQLLEKVKRNDSPAFTVLYNRYHRRLYGYCLRMLGNVEMAEDVFHDVIIKMYDNREAFSGGNFAKWIFTIARTRCLNSIRDRKHAEDITDLSDVLVGNYAEAGEHMFIKEALRKAISALPDEFREVLILKQFNEYSYDEISKITGISVSLAKVRVFRAIKMLQKTLSPYLREVK